MSSNFYLYYVYLCEVVTSYTIYICNITDARHKCILRSCSTLLHTNTHTNNNDSDFPACSDILSLQRIYARDFISHRVCIMYVVHVECLHYYVIPSMVQYATEFFFINIYYVWLHRLYYVPKYSICIYKMCSVYYARTL